ncbi:MAG: DUF1836 domain-containing protein [Oscillospiraceae bacterium]|nr:DUF1836 domain-containing protein [Oscillospiraceae bacterium]
MDKIRNTAAEVLRNFRLPRYEELPAMGLYLEQTVKYINLCLEPLGGIGLTGSMIRNYVKMGLVSNPVQKQYHAGHIAHLIAAAVLKQVLELDNIKLLFSRQHTLYTDEVAYNYFCAELENVLYFRAGLKNTMDEIGSTHSIEKEVLRSAVIAVAHIFILNLCLEQLPRPEDTKE